MSPTSDTKYRCTDTACRGNAPCTTCRVWLSTVIQRAVDKAVVTGVRLTPELKATLAELEKVYIGSIHKELEKGWATVVPGVVRHSANTRPDERLEVTEEEFKELAHVPRPRPGEHTLTRKRVTR